MTIVVNLKIDQCDVKIDRTTKWGNPFRLINNSPAQHKAVIRQYEKYIRSRPDLLNALPELVGKRLGC